MANPQRENGYTAIANEILEALARTNIHAEPRRILDVIIRKTYGFNKREDKISLSQFVLSTGITRNNVCRALNKLKNMNIVLQRENGLTHIYRLNKDFETWRPFSNERRSPMRDVSNERMPILQRENETFSNERHTIYNTKDTLTKERISTVPTSHPIGQFAKFWEAYPKKEGKKKAEDIWNRKNLDNVLPDILAFIEKAKQTKRWQEGFIKAPTTFLNGESWNDDISAYGNGNLSSDPIMNKAKEIAAKARIDWPNDPDQARLDGINRLCEFMGIGDFDPDRFKKVGKYAKILGY